MDEVRKVLDPMPGFEYSFTQPIEMRVSEMIIGVRGDLAVKIFGPDLVQLNTYASQIETLLKTVPGNEDVYTVQNDGVQYLRVAVDRLQAGRVGLTVEDVQDALRTQVEGQRAGIVVEGNRRTPIIVRGGEMMRVSPADFAAMRITTGAGYTVALNAVAKLERTAGPVKIDRELGSRYSVGLPMSVAVIWSALCKMQRPWSPNMLSSRVVTASVGAASSRISSARRRACRWWCRWHLV